MATGQRTRIISEPRGNRLITMIVVLSVGVIVLATGAVVLIMRDVAASQAMPPGPGGYAKSASVRNADDDAAAWQDQEFASLSQLAPWGRASRTIGN